MHIHAQFFPKCSGLCFNSRQWGGSRRAHWPGPPRNTEKRRRKYAPTSTTNLPFFFGSLSHLQLCPESKYLHSRCHARSRSAMAFWSTSCVFRRPLSDAAGWAERSRHGAVRRAKRCRCPLSTSPVNNTAGCGPSPQHSADTPDFPN